MLTVTHGWLAGSAIRKARKHHTCDYWHGRRNGGRCGRAIEPNDFYVEGDGNNDAGGYGNDRYCRECVGNDARNDMPANP